MSYRRSQRYEREQRQRRLIVLIAGGVIGVTVLILIGGFYLSSVAPNIRELGHVYDTKVTTGDFYAYRKIQLYNQLSFYQQFAAQQGQQSSQFQTQIDQLTNELKNIATDKIEGDRVSSLNQYMDDLLVEHDAQQAPLNITVSKDQLDQLARNEFVPATSTATLPAGTATAQSNVTATANTNATATEGVRGTKTANVSGTQTVSAQATATLQPGYTAPPTTVAPTTVAPTATATATAGPGTATPTSTPLSTAAVQGTATVQLGQVLQDLKKNTSISADDYKKYVVLPGEYRRQVEDKLKSQVPAVGTTIDQMHLYELKFTTEGDAKDAVAQIKAANGDAAKIKDIFAKIADEKNSDQPSPSKENAGDRGWLPSDGSGFANTEKEIEKAAKALKAGEASNQIGTNDGWYVLWVAEKGPRPLSDVTQQAIKDNVMARWVDTRRDIAKAAGQYAVNTDIVPPTPTTGPTATAAPTDTAVPPTATSTPKPIPGLPTKAAPTTSATNAANGTTTPGVTTVPPVPTLAPGSPSATP